MSDIKNENIIKFFNNKASCWDKTNCAGLVGARRLVDMFSAEINNAKVLDIGCGTGILETFLLEKNAKEIDGVDISDQMIKIAKRKFSKCKNVTYYCDSITGFSANKQYDIVFLYNVYPHFSDKKSVVKSIDKLTNTNSDIVIAHGSSKQDINEHHKSHAYVVSTELFSAKLEAEIWKEKFSVINLIDDDSFYMIHLKKNN